MHGAQANPEAEPLPVPAPELSPEVDELPRPADVSAVPLHAPSPAAGATMPDATVATVAYQEP
ncbi:MAG: hypothetical protein MUF48_19285, partial [Pirellulaceae bacterium]|nr:hypothetical protein [Pirellulaceae bacterium]